MTAGVNQINTILKKFAKYKDLCQNVSVIPEVVSVGRKVMLINPRPREEHLFMEVRQF